MPLLDNSKFIIILVSDKKKFEQYYFFIHIPKTAGSSFRSMLYKQFPQDVIYPNLKDIRANRGHYPYLKAAREVLQGERQVQFLMGHYPYAIGKKLPKDPECIVFLRDPMERAISNIYHLQQNNPRFKNISERVIIESAVSQINNIHVRFLGDWRFRPKKLFTAETEWGAKAIIRAKRNLDSCAFVGFTEYFEESVAALQQKFNWKLGRILKKNTTSKRRKSPLSDDLYEKLTALNQLDIELYNYAVEKHLPLIVNRC